MSGSKSEKLVLTSKKVFWLFYFCFDKPAIFKDLIKRSHFSRYSQFLLVAEVGLDLTVGLVVPGAAKINNIDSANLGSCKSNCVAWNGRGIGKQKQK